MASSWFRCNCLSRLSSNKRYVLPPHPGAVSWSFACANPQPSSFSALHRRYGIMSSPAEGLAAQQPPTGIQAASKYAVSIQSLDRILRTGGFKTAVVAQQGRQETLVKANTANEQFTHHATAVRASAQVHRRIQRPTRIHLTSALSPPIATPAGNDACNAEKTPEYAVSRDYAQPQRQLYAIRQGQAGFPGPHPRRHSR